LPVTSLEGYPAARVRVALADGAGNAVWLGTEEGWARYDAAVGRWDQGGVPGGVTSLMLDASDQASGVFVQSAAGWGFLPRGSMLPIPGRPLPPPGRRIQPLDPRTALDRVPLADAMRALILTDPQLRRHRFTAAARSPDRSDLFLGTDGMALVRVDALTGDWERLSFGLIAARAGAVAPGSGGVWVGTSGGLGLLAPGTSDVTVPLDVAEQPALRAPIVALGRVGDTLVAITPDQLAWRDPASRRWTLLRAPDRIGRVGALAADGSGVWLAATNALAFWDLSASGFRVLTAPLDVPG